MIQVNTASNGRPQAQYLVRSFEGGEITTKVMTREEKDALERTQFDLCMDYSRGETWLRHLAGDTKLKKAKQQQGGWVPLRFGPVQWDLLRDILLATPDYVLLEALPDVQSCLYRIRRDLKEKPSRGVTPLFETMSQPNYSARFRPDRTWLTIEPLPKDFDLKSLNTD